MKLYEDGLDYACQALVIARERQDEESILSLLTSIGNNYYDLGQYDKARQAYEEAIEMAVRLQDWKAHARLLARLSALAADQGELKSSLEFAQQALKLAKKVGDHRLVGEQYMMLAFGYR